MLLELRLIHTLVSPRPHGELLDDDKTDYVPVDAADTKPDPLPFPLAMTRLMDFVAVY